MLEARTRNVFWLIDFNISAEDIISRYIGDGAFDDAISVARSLSIDMSDLYKNLTRRCVQLSWAPYQE